MSLVYEGLIIIFKRKYLGDKTRTLKILIKTKIFTSDYFICYKQDHSFIPCVTIKLSFIYNYLTIIHL